MSSTMVRFFRLYIAFLIIIVIPNRFVVDGDIISLICDENNTISICEKSEGGERKLTVQKDDDFIPLSKIEITKNLNIFSCYLRVTSILIMVVSGTQNPVLFVGSLLSSIFLDEISR